LFDESLLAGDPGVRLVTCYQRFARRLPGALRRDE